MLGTLLLAMLAAPFVAGGWGHYSFRPPTGGNKAAEAGASRSGGQVAGTSGEADIAALKGRLTADLKALVTPVEGGEPTGRMAGSPGAERSAKMIEERFRSAGLANVCTQDFPVTVPVTLESSLTVGGKSYPARPLWPNGSRTCTTGREVTGTVIFGANGNLDNLNGQDVAGSILVLDGDQGLSWVTACSFGVRAVVFVEPSAAGDIDLQSKVLTAAVDIPRFWLPRAEGLKLIESLKAAGKDGLPGAVKARVDWQNRTARNVYGLVPGTNPARQKAVTVVLAHYDSPSLVPDLAPGADAAASMAASLELIRRLKDNPPERPVLFVAVGAHYQALLGEAHAVDTLRRPVNSLIDEIGRLDGKALGVDSRSVLQASGVTVSGLLPWQRVMLIVMGALFALGAVAAYIFVKASSGTRRLIAVSTLVAGAALVIGLNSHLGRERKSTAEEIAAAQAAPWKACSYNEFRGELTKLQVRNPDLAGKLLAMVARREEAERAAVAARGQVVELQQQEVNRRKDLARQGSNQYSPAPAEWAAKFVEASARLDAAARAAADFQKSGSGQEAVAPPALADYLAMRELLTKAKKADPISVELENCLMALANLEERQKNESTGRLKYLRDCSYLSFIARLGADVPERIKSCVAFDITSHSQRMAAFFKGRYVYQMINKDEKIIQASTAPMAEFLSSTASGHAIGLNWALATDRTPFVTDTTVPMSDRPWNSLCPAAPNFGAETFTLAGIPSITMGTAFDSRRVVDTPLDTIENMDLESLSRQTEVSVRAVLDLFGSGSAGSRGLAALEKTEAQNELRSYSEVLRISGLVTEYNPAKSRTLSVTPVPGALVLTRRESVDMRDVRPTYNAVRTYGAALADEWGSYEFFCLPAAKYRLWSDQEQRMLAYELDPQSGRIVQALDDGEQGQKRGKPWRTPKRDEDEYFLTTFPCSALNVFEVSDLRSFETLDTQFSDVRIYIGQNDSVPISWGISMVGETPGNNRPEHAMVLFVSDRKDAAGRSTVTRVKAAMGRRRLAGVRWPFLAVSGEGWLKEDRSLQATEHQGKGVDVSGNSKVVDRDSGKRIPEAMMMAQDLYRLDDYRLYVLDKAGVRNASLVKQHEAAGRELAAAQKAAEQKKWDRMLSSARASWGFEARAYPNIQSTVTDVVKGLLFYLFLMLPFAYFVERLLFAFPDINRQLAGVFGIFMVTFALLYVMHPAFKITSSAPMILLAFITIALAILVISMISSRFKRELEALQQRPGRNRKADMDRVNAAVSAFLLGINNMRRRKVRTVLTLVTLVLLTFSVLSFSSIESTLGANKRSISSDKDQPYQGILVRNENWSTLDEFAYSFLRTELAIPGSANESVVSPRAWMAAEGMQIYMSAADNQANPYVLSGLLGVLPQEREITGMGASEMLAYGRWFLASEGNAPVCIVPEKLLRDGFKIDPTSVRDGARYEDLPALLLGSERLTVVGVLKDQACFDLKDIDGESPVPVDYGAEGWQRGSGRAAGSEAAEFRKYTHLDPRTVPVVPYGWLMRSGGRLASISILPKNPLAVQPLAEDHLLRRVSVPMFVSSRREVNFMSTATSNDVSGMGNLIVPMLIAALIVLNTMLGAVYEREKEISIYGALGLAPVHIGSLFIAESAVFAVVSAVLGYVLGQSVAKLAVTFPALSDGLLGGISLNYSSLSAVFSACFIIAVVMLSAVYPAFRAGRLSVPDVERIWKFPQPDGDRLVFDFPFTVSGEQALGVNKHLVHFFKDHANQSVGEFYTADTGFAYRNEQDKKSGGYKLNSRIWIAPFDFGISQTLELETFLAEGETDIYETRMILTRTSGSPDSWVKMNHRFMKGIRKQFLLWRLFSPEERSWHVGQARALLGEVTSTENQARPAAETGDAARAHAG